VKGFVSVARKWGSRLGWGGRSADPENRMSRSGLTFPPAAVRGDDLPALVEAADGAPRSSPRRRVVCLVSACAGILVAAGVAGGVIGLRGGDRPAGRGYAHQASAARSHEPGVLPGAGMLPASGTPAGVVPYAPTAAAFPAESEPATAPRPSPDSPARSTLRSVPPPAYPGRTPTPGVGTAAPSPASTPGPTGSGSPSPGTSGGGSPSPGPSGSGSPSAPDGT
jgi:hypothetical protein